ncbi:MAG: hypothetical protein AB8G99_03565 [Planctomycetaceae bacterium]
MNLLRSIKNLVAPQPQRRIRSEQQSRPEVLETRTLLSNVTVSVKNGDLLVQGDKANNQIRLAGSSNGSVIVSGLNGTTINGSMYSRTYRVQDDVRLAFNKGGNNKVLLEEVVADDLSYKGGHGRDQLGVRYGSLNDVSVKTSGGNDTVLFQTVQGIDSININTGHGRDDIGVAGISGNVTINSGHGNDGVLVVGGAQGSGNIKTGGGKDYLALYSTAFSRDVNVKTGHGSDEVWVTNTTIGGKLNVHGGGDSDALMIDGSSISSTSRKSIESNSISNAFGKASDVSDRLTDIWNY